MRDLIDSFEGRLIKLSDGRDGLRSLIHPVIKAAPGTDAAQLDFVASDETVDRYDEVISAAGWDLANYRKNPVFQNSHQYGDIIHTLGKSVVHEVIAGKLVQRIEFAVDINPLAKIAYELYRGGFLNAVSVGFVPNDWKDGAKGDPFRRKFTSQELLELSAVSIPANPNALALGLKAGAIDKLDLREAANLLRHAIGDKAAPTRNASQAAGEGDAWQSARNEWEYQQLRALLRTA